MTRRVKPEKRKKPWEIDRGSFTSKFEYDDHCAFFALRHHEHHPISLLAEAFKMNRRVMYKICNPGPKSYFHVLVRHHEMTHAAMFSKYVTESHKRSIRIALAARAARRRVPLKGPAVPIDSPAPAPPPKEGQDGPTGGCAIDRPGAPQREI